MAKLDGAPDATARLLLAPELSLRGSTAPA